MKIPATNLNLNQLGRLQKQISQWKKNACLLQYLQCTIGRKYNSSNIIKMFIFIQTPHHEQSLSENPNGQLWAETFRKICSFFTFWFVKVKNIKILNMKNVFIFSDNSRKDDWKKWDFSKSMKNQFFHSYFLKYLWWKKFFLHRYFKKYEGKIDYS